jgi:hypothetical protein
MAISLGILSDFEKVKDELLKLVPDYQLQQETQILKNLISFADKFRNDSLNIKRNLVRKDDLTMDRLKMYQNQINFLNLLSEMMLKIAKINSYSRNPHAQEELRLLLEYEVMALKRRGMSTIGMTCQFSDQEKEELRNEILRVQLIVSYRILDMLIQEKEIKPHNTDELDMKLIGQTIASGNCIGESVT